MNKVLSKTFLWMFVGLLITFATGYVVSINENMINSIFGGNLFWILAIVEIVLIIYFSTRIYKLKPTAAKITFFLYSFVSGLTFSSIFLTFNIGSIIYAFLVTAVTFGIFGLIGYFTKLDLSKLGTILLMALIAVVLCTIVNMFLGNETFDLIVTIISVLIFFGFTAYDVNRLKVLHESGLDSDIVAIHGALELYLDFINIFIHLISLLGNSDN